MNTTDEFLESLKLVGIALPFKTSNQNGQSGTDCGNLWQQFEKGNYIEKIPGRLTDEIIAVYYDYEGDHTKPFSYFIGCKTSDNSVIPDGLQSLTIDAGSYKKLTVKGKMPDCVAEGWKEIWQSNFNRAYRKDFEIYGNKSKDWNNAEVTIFISVN